MPAMRALPVTSLSFLVLGGAYLIESLNLPLGPAAQPGPGFFPLLVGIAMMAFSLRVLIQSLKTKECPAEKEDLFPKGRDLQRVVLIAAALIFFAAFLNILGYGVCSAVLIGAVLRFLGLKSWTRIFLISVLTAVLSYLLFASVLEAPLPRGVLFS